MSREVVLVADDDPDLADLYATWLCDGYRVRVTHDGRAALDAVDDSVSVALLDREMPEERGEAVAEAIAASDVDCQVAFVSGIEPDFDIVDCPIDGYLTKPVSRDELLDLVQSLCARRRYDDPELTELFSLVAKRGVLFAHKSDAELVGRDEYLEVVRRIQRLNASVDGIHALSTFDPNALLHQLESLPAHGSDD